MRSSNFAYIDGANLHLTYEHMDWKLDYQKLRNYLAKKLDIFVAYYFIGKTKESSEICENLESYGYTVKPKQPVVHTTKEEYCPYCNKVVIPAMSRPKSDCDSFMTLQVMSDWNLFNKAVLITSDGDFDELVIRLLRQDKLKMVFAPCKDGCSGLLTSAADGRIAFIDDFRSELEKI
jgi:uncharacterized LabA/DUF88 family protein